MLAPIIVLEGLDASGKSTQTQILIESLKNQGMNVGWKQFPGYKETPAGVRIAAYLRGEYGDFHHLDPKLIASLYAADRLFQLESIEQMRRENEVVIFDRGATTNAIYTPARAKNETEMLDFMNFIETLEYEVYGFPRESLVIFLEASQKARYKIHASKGRLADLHEADETYLQQVNKVALKKCADDFRWQKIVVDRDGELRRREEIASEILALVSEKLQCK